MSVECRKVGSIFLLNGVKLKVEQESDDFYCFNSEDKPCFFRSGGGKCKGLLRETGDCRPRYRVDHRAVVFIEQRKEEK